MAQLAALPFLTAAGALQAQTNRKQLKILMKSAWGSDDPTKAAFPFSHGLALAEAGHEVQIYLLGEAVVLMRKVVADAVTPVGWPTVGDFLNKLAGKHVQIYACGACARARGVTETDLTKLWSEIRQPTHLRFAGRMGGPCDHGVGDSGLNEGLIHWGSQLALRYT
jgi:uncharacterized protein involved in oxidation of intracellular sulfur